MFSFLCIIDEASHDEIAMKWIELFKNAANDEEIEDEVVEQPECNVDDKDGDVHGERIVGGGSTFRYELVFVGTHDFLSKWEV